MSIFDMKKATIAARRVRGSFHDAWQDPDGNTCLLCVSRASGGGVSVGKAGLEWLRAVSGERFLYLKNEGSGFKKLVRLDNLPPPRWQPGKDGGEYAIFDCIDFGDGPFPE